MVTSELLDFISVQRKIGKKEEEIQKILHHAGWKEADIAEAFNTKVTDFHVPIPQPSHTLILPNMESLIGKSIDIYRRIWTKVACAVGITFAMTFALILLVVGVFLLILSQKSIIELPSTPGSPLISGFAVLLFFGLIISTIIAVLCFLYITLWGQLAIIHLIDNWDKIISAKNAFRQTRKKVFGFVWIVILCTFITVGGYAFFIIPGVLFSIWFIFAPFIYLTEGKKGMHALLQSKKYVDGFFIPVSMKLFLLGLLVGVLQIIVGIPFFLLTGYALLIHSEILSVVPRVISYITGSIIFTPIVLIFTYLLYANLKKEKGESSVTNFKYTRNRVIAVAIAGYLFATIMTILFFYAALSFSKEQKQQQFYNRSYKLSPTPRYKYPVNISDPTISTTKCIKASKEDICEGYKLIVPGYTNSCYLTIKQCLDVEQSITPSPSPSPSLYKKPATSPTNLPVFPGV